MTPTDLRNYLHFLSNCKSMEELWTAHTEKMADFGFDRLIYGFTRYRSDTSLGAPEDFIILTNHDKAYTDVFLGEAHYADAPMVNWALTNEGAGSWGILASENKKRELTAAELRVLEFNLSMGVTAGYTIRACGQSPRATGFSPKLLSSRHLSAGIAGYFKLK